MHINCRCFTACYFFLFEVASSLSCTALVVGCKYLQPLYLLYNPGDFVNLVHRYPFIWVCSFPVGSLNSFAVPLSLSLQVSGVYLAHGCGWGFCLICGLLCNVGCKDHSTLGVKKVESSREPISLIEAFHRSENYKLAKMMHFQRK